MTDLNPHDVARRCAEALLQRDAASRALGITLISAAPGRAQVSMRVRDDMLQGHGTCHGGFLFALADTAFALACNSHDAATVAQGCSIEYLVPGQLDDELVAHAQELHRGKRTGTYDVRIDNQHGQPVALFRGKSYQVRGTVLAQEAIDK
ncbi:hydroxyphenylacetyl-CoA thioesterase PaaI [Pseudomonas sp. RIT-To-2]|uniref:hydroxyphenylacetyl-CoA thioesterase PaaI n=1 Tax=Pseudomonas sp. RIT-To-2 TaxID=3462541 RepID=UPI0024139FB7